jgi:hypothetical protein
MLKKEMDSLNNKESDFAISLNQIRNSFIQLIN